MPTAEHCRAMAAEADRLASIVSYGRDKVRLHEQARSWRERAEALNATVVTGVEQTPVTAPRRLMGWLRRRSD